MNSKQASNLHFRKIIGIVAVAVIGFHLLLCVLIIISPTSRIAQTKLGRNYNYYVLLGPFFSEDRIQHSLHLTVRSSTDNVWSGYNDLCDKYFRAYWRAPWRLHQILMRDYARKVGDDFSTNATNNTFENFKNTYSFKRLNRFISSEIDAFDQKDSVQVLYIVRWSKPYSEDIRYDTLFNVTYSPRSIEASR